MRLFGGLLLEAEGIILKTSEGVYTPSDDTFLAVSILKKQLCNSKYTRILGIGTGTGINGIIAAESPNVERVVLTDLTEAPLELARENAIANGVSEKCSFVKSDLFENIEESFDLIIFNPPYLPDDWVKAGRNEWSGGPTGIETTKRFIEGAASHLKQEGAIISVKSSLADSHGLDSFIAEHGFQIEDSETKHIFFEDITAFAAKRHSQ